MEERVGIRLGEHQRQFLQSQVNMRMRELGEEDITRYFLRVSDRVAGRHEWTILLDRLVVKETNFFRHEPSYSYVSSCLQDKINNASLNSSYDIWSLGCSTGEEAYSLAMLINESFELAKIDAHYSVTATDISRLAISLAREARFSARKLEFVPPSFRYKYFSEAADEQFIFDHDVAQRICFSMANILQAESMPPLQFDLVYCQNLLVYFQQGLRHRVLDAVVEKLKVGGVLIIGLGEVMNWTNPRVERVARAEVQAYVRLDV